MKKWIRRFLYGIAGFGGCLALTAAIISFQGEKIHLNLAIVGALIFLIASLILQRFDDSE